MSRKLAIVALTATLMTIPFAGVAQARQAAAAQPYYSVDTKLADVFANPAAAAVFTEFFRKRSEASGQPEASAEEKATTAELIKGLSSRELAGFPQANLDEDALKALNAELAKVPAPAAAAAAPAAGSSAH